MIHHLLHLLLYVAKGLCILNMREKRTIPESNFITFPGILNHTFEAPTSHSKQLFPSYSGSWIKANPSDCRTIPGTPPSRCVRNPNYEGWVESACRANQVMGLPLTIFHDMWLVRSKRLTTTTTHCDLSQFINTDVVHFQAMIHNPVRDPYGDCRISKHSTPMSRE